MERDEGLFEMVATQMPDGVESQLLRSIDDSGVEQDGEAHERFARRLEVACGPVIVFVVSQVRDVARRRLVMPSRRALGLARRTNRLHQL